MAATAGHVPGKHVAHIFTYLLHFALKQKQNFEGANVKQYEKVV